MRTLTLLNQSSSALQANLILALNQYSAMVAMHWGEQCQVILGSTLPSNGWAMVLKDECDVAGALGYHEVVNNQPIAYIGMQTCIKAGVTPSSCMAHELAEMQGDPYCQWMAQDPNTGFIYPRELCDPVEATTFSILGVEVSNFVYQQWFSPAPASSFDHMNTLKRPFSLAPNGYVSVVENGSYTTVWGDKASREAMDRKHPRLDKYKQIWEKMGIRWSGVRRQGTTFLDSKIVEHAA